MSAQGGRDPKSETDAVEKSLRALRTRIAAVDAQVNADRAVLPARLAAVAFAVAVFVLSAVPWVTVGSQRPKTYSLWGFVERLEGPSVVALLLVLVLAGTILWAGCLAEPGSLTPIVTWVLTVLVLAGLFWVSRVAGEEFGDRYDDSVEWWPAPWLLVICAVAGASAISARKR